MASSELDVLLCLRHSEQLIATEDHLIQGQVHLALMKLRSKEPGSVGIDFLIGSVFEYKSLDWIPDYIQLSGLEKKCGGPSLVVGLDL